MLGINVSSMVTNNYLPNRTNPIQEEPFGRAFKTYAWSEAHLPAANLLVYFIWFSLAAHKGGGWQKLNLFVPFLKMWVWALTLFWGMVWWWHWGYAHFGEVGGLWSSPGGSSVFLSPSVDHRCWIASAASQRPLLPQIWKHMKRAMTHGLQLFQWLDTGTDRLGSHVFITPTG